jgi:DNA-directed RNA polymerase beta' subunit
MIFADPGRGHLRISTPDTWKCTPGSRSVSTASWYNTTPGRIIIREIVPGEVPFEVYNREMSKKVIGRLVGEAYRLAGTKATVILCDKLKDLGFEYSTQAGITVGVKDLTIPPGQVDYSGPFAHRGGGHRAAVPRGYHHPHREIQQGRRRLDQSDQRRG